MCTAVTYYPNDHYFGRNLDLENSLNEQVIITPHAFPVTYRKGTVQNDHYAMIGIGIVANAYPLYYDACNEHGLCMAGLNFPGNAVYHQKRTDCENVAPFELIPWILCNCKNVAQARELLARTNIMDENFSNGFPNTPLHWIVSDKCSSITVESVLEGLKIYDNPFGVLTNNPPFDYHMHNLSNYMNLTCEKPTNRFAPSIELKPYSLGMGAIGLPGDLSSASRFVRAAFTKLNSRCSETEESAISQFFHILGSVAQSDGCTKVGDRYERTVYSDCCNMDRCIYYYTTYENSQIHGVSLFAEQLNSRDLITYPLVNTQNIQWVNT